MIPAAIATTADGDDEIVFDCPTLIRAYRSGRIERLCPDDYIPASLDPTTGVNSKDCIINPASGLSARLYLPSVVSADEKLPILVYYHGGGFCIMSAFCSLYHDFLNSLTAKARVITVSVEYRLAPENPIPAAYEDAWEAMNWVSTGADPWMSSLGNFEKIFLAGDSAGGNIVHNMGMRLGREGRKVEGAALLHPFFWGEERIGAEGEEREGTMFATKDAEGIWRLASGGKLGFDDPRINPWAEGAPRLRELGCRRALVCVAGLDFLSVRGRVYYEKLKDINGGWEGMAELVEVDGEDHVFFLLNPGSQNAIAFVERLIFAPPSCALTIWVQDGHETLITTSLLGQHISDVVIFSAAVGLSSPACQLHLRRKPMLRPIIACQNIAIPATTFIKADEEAEDGGADEAAVAGEEDLGVLSKKKEVVLWSCE